MLSRLILLLLVLASCQRGLIPCPEIEVVRFKDKSAFKQKSVLMARKEEPEEKTFRRPKDKVIQNVTIEEWDCPRPGKKKYMPRSVKHNIRKNEQRIHLVDSVGFSSADRK